jgi:hypothetical protein
MLSEGTVIFEISAAARGVLQLLRGLSEDGSGLARLAIQVDEVIALHAVVPLPLDGEVSVGIFDVDGSESLSRVRGAASTSSLSSSQASPMCMGDGKDFPSRR